MDDKELLQLYFDGELNGADAERAEKLLENDPEAASEFADLTAIRRACENERLAIAAPSDSRDKIFAAVGYSTIGLPYLIKRYSLIAGIVLLVSVALYWALDNRIDNTANIKNETDISVNSRPTEPPVISSKEIPQDNSVAAARPKARSGARVERNYGSVTPSPSAETNAITQAPTQQAPYPAQDRRPELSRSTITPTPMKHNALANAVSLFELLTIESPAPKTANNKDWSLTFRGGTPQNANLKFGKLTNLSLSLLRFTGNGVYIGLEGGSVYFTKNTKDEVTNEVSQISDNVFFIGIGGKYQKNDIDALGFIPFGSASVRFSGYGPVGKFGVGLQRSLFSDRIDLIFEYDYNQLFYKYDGSYKGSGTHGLNVGLMYKF